MLYLFSSLIGSMASKLYDYLNYFFGLSDRLFQGYDPLRIYYYNYWIYVFSGFWKYDSPSQWKTKLYKIYRNVIAVVYGVYIAFFMVDAVVVRHDLDKLSFNMSSTVLVVMKITQIILLSSLKYDVEEICNKLDNNFYIDTIGESKEDKSILKQKAEVILNITLVFYTLLLGGLPLRVIADTALDTRAYLIPVPFKEKLENYYQYLYAQQVIISFHFMITNLSYDLLTFTFMVRFIAHYEILEKNIHKIKTFYPKRNYEKYVRGYVEGQQADVSQDVLIHKTNYAEKMQKFMRNYKLARINIAKCMESEKPREEKTFKLLKEYINHHQRLLKEITNFSNIYSRPLLIQTCGMVILSGIAALQILFLSNEINLLLLQQLLYACITLLNIFILCSFGSELTGKSLSVANALYDIPWYDMSINNKRMVYLIMKRLIEAPKLKGGGMISIDRFMCVKFLQTSYNMVALLRNKVKTNYHD